ncbi:MAG: hypothetical protein A4E53_03513 [Pelotomaculum sp. PtaB.Bin104]|nr:MAG: hypothetical protein A4E53_03513 [Pelotomaculum sp. PtaB.Bin104]
MYNSQTSDKRQGVHAESANSEITSTKACPVRCGNLLQNPSFEAGLFGWETANVSSMSRENVFEGTQVARMGYFEASMFQDVSIANTGHEPLFLSFNVIQTADPTRSVGKLVAEVLWLDADRNTIAYGLRLHLPNGRINTVSWLTLFDITDQPPAGAVWARLLFSRRTAGETDIDIDQVILAPVDTANLVQNPSFELGLTDWTAAKFKPTFERALEGVAAVVASESDTLYQDVPLTNLPVNSSFLFSFAGLGFDGPSLSVKVLWVNETDAVIGTGLDLSIPSLTNAQGNYLSFLDITSPAPAAAKARILFTATVPIASNLRLDQVILARVPTTNLVQNPSYENGLNNWFPVNVTSLTTNLAYEGTKVARVDEDGGVLFQQVPIAPAADHCFLLNFGLGYRKLENVAAYSGDILAKVYWLDQHGREIGLGLSLVLPGFIPSMNQWRVYTGITEPAPRCAVTARVQFTKEDGSTLGVVDIDHVVLSRLV